MTTHPHLAPKNKDYSSYCTPLLDLPGLHWGELYFYCSVPRNYRHISYCPMLRNNLDVTLLCTYIAYLVVPLKSPTSKLTTHFFFTYIDRVSSVGVAARPRTGPGQVMRNIETVEPGCGDPISRSLIGRREYSEPRILPRSEAHRSRDFNKLGARAPIPHTPWL